MDAAHADAGGIGVDAEPKGEVLPPADARPTALAGS